MHEFDAEKMTMAHTTETAIAQLTEDNFEQVVGKKGIALVLCSAQWCGVCKVFVPTFQQVASKHAVHVFASLDTDEQRTLAERLGIKHVPALLVYRDGLLLLNTPGSFTAETLENIIHQAETIDLDRVREDIAKADRVQSQNDDSLELQAGGVAG